MQAEGGSRDLPQELLEHCEGPCPLRATLRAAMAMVGLDDMPAANLGGNQFC